MGSSLVEPAQHTDLLLRLLTANLRDMVVWLRADGVRLFMSDGVAETLGWTRQEAIGMPPLGMVHPDDVQHIQEVLGRLFRDGGEAMATFRGNHKDGREVWLEALGRRVNEDAIIGQPSIIYTARDITARLLAERALDESRRKLQAIADSLPALIVHVDANEICVFANARSAQQSDLHQEQMLGAHLRTLMGEEGYHVAAPHVAAAKRGAHGRYERELDVDGTKAIYEFICQPDGTTSEAGGGVYLLGYDISHRKLVERHLHDLARTDMLTGLANRRHFEEALESALASHARNFRPLALMLIDLDGFKEINDVHGHQAGDAVLKAVAVRLHEAAFDVDLIARQGGDEFAVLLGDACSAESAELLAARLKVALAHPIQILAGAVGISASIGIAYCNGDLDAREFTHLADCALYAAKEAGRNTHRALRKPGAR
jgi:diguanylate cyclase (GGDEF)-like protein/PAS domain S-box-containing protein